MRVSRYLWIALVLGLFCAPLFAGLGRLDMENDEAGHSYSVESILETGDWLTPRSSPTPWAAFVEKPPLKFWIVALPIRLGLLPDTEFGLRFWDAAFGGMAFLYLFAVGRRLAGPFCGLVAALVLFTFDPLLFNHGLRSNSMEAAVLLAYCGGMYHFMRWYELAAPRPRRRHAYAVGLYFALGFMCKFVAALFLPLVIAAVSLMLPPVGRAVRRQWRAWAAVAAVVTLLVAPWFIYQSARMGREFWGIILGQHVVQRFNSWLDPSHLHPWGFYFAQIFTEMTRAHSFWLAVAGGILLLARILRDQWVDGTLVLFWFALPLAVISLGSSKLVHYAYPFLPPVALAAGYALAVAAEYAVAIVFGPRPAWITRLVGWPAGSVRDWARRIGRRVADPLMGAAARLAPPKRAAAGLRIALLVLSAACLALAVVALVHHGRLKLGGMTIVRHPSVIRSAIGAIVLGALAGRGAGVARIGVAVMLLALAPVQAYRAVMPRLMVENHPLRSVRDCLVRVREQERRAGRRVPELFVVLPPGVYGHPYYFYFRQTGWNTHDEVSDEALSAMMNVPGAERPVILPQLRFDRYRLAQYRVGAPPLPRVGLGLVLVLTPGPFAQCGTE